MDMMDKTVNVPQEQNHGCLASTRAFGQDVEFSWLARNMQENRKHAVEDALLTISGVEIGYQLQCKYTA
ncbi:hypothetical protein C5167_041802 [Papaver somniferum]|nr:hypothetical protein C5167_041802 [Papaver somniferum]